MEISLEKASFDQKHIIGNMLELYCHDLSENEDMELNNHGLYSYKYLDHYWTEMGRHPFIVRVDGKLAGFALVRDSSNTNNCHSIAEFFIVRKYRRRSLGRMIAHRIFDMFPGRWRIGCVDNNKLALAFWNKVIYEYTNGKFDEISDPSWTKGPMREFFSLGRR